MNNLKIKVNNYGEKPITPPPGDNPFVEVGTTPSGLKVWKKKGEVGQDVYFGESCGIPAEVFDTVSGLEELRLVVADLNLFDVPGDIQGILNKYDELGSATKKVLAYSLNNMAENRLGAAVHWLEKNSEGVFDGNENLIYHENLDCVLKALRIAAGLEKIKA